MGLFDYSFVVVSIGNLITFSAGTAFTWASPEISKLENSILAITTEQASWITSLYHLGAVFGPFLFGNLADRIGRKLTLAGTGVPIAIGFLLMAFVENLYVYYVARFISGISVGGIFTVMPMYIGELADSSKRGFLAGLMNLYLCIGMLYSYCLGPYLSVSTFNLTLSIFPILFILAFLLLAVETPRYLIGKNKLPKAKEILQRLRGADKNIDEEIFSIEKAITNEGQARIMDLFTTSGNFKAFYISIGLLAFQQFSGINAVLSYSQNIFEQAGSSIAPEVCAMIIGIVQLISSFMSTALSDKLGRKYLLFVSGIGMVFSEVLLGIYSYLKDQAGKDLSNIAVLPVISLIVYMLTYNVGMGTLPWTIMGELYPSNVKSVGSSLNSSLCWVMAFIIVKYFQIIKEAIGLGPCFFIFSVFCAFSIAFTKYIVIETKQKTLEQIQKELNE